MFVENYRLDTMIGGQAQTAIPYPKISEAENGLITQWHSKNGPTTGDSNPC
jgi:hypothetical protein